MTRSRSASVKPANSATSSASSTKNTKKPSGTKNVAAVSKLPAPQAPSVQPSRSESSTGAKKRATRSRATPAQPKEAAQPVETVEEEESHESTKEASTVPDALIEPSPTVEVAESPKTAEPANLTVSSKNVSIEPTGSTETGKTTHSFSSGESEGSNENGKQASGLIPDTNLTVDIAQPSKPIVSNNSSDSTAISTAEQAAAVSSDSIATAKPAAINGRPRRVKTSKVNKTLAPTSTDLGQSAAQVPAEGRTTRSKQNAKEPEKRQKTVPPLTLYDFLKEKYAKDPNEPRNHSVLGEIKSFRDEYVDYLNDNHENPTISQLRDLNTDEVMRVGAPQDPVEYQRSARVRFAPLISGTPNYEVNDINDALLKSDGKMKKKNGEPSERRKAMQENTDFPLQLWLPGTPLRPYASASTSSRAGVATHPINIDPPGSGGAFDANNFPKIYTRNGELPPEAKAQAASKRPKRAAANGSKRKADEITDQEVEQPNKRSKKAKAPANLAPIIEENEDGLEVGDGADFPMQSVEESKQPAKKRKASGDDGPAGPTRRSARNRSAQPIAKLSDAARPNAVQQAVQASDEAATAPRRSGRKRSASVLDESENPSKRLKSAKPEDPVASQDDDVIVVNTIGRKRAASVIDEPAEAPRKRQQTARLRSKTEQPTKAETAASASSKGHRKTATALAPSKAAKQKPAGNNKLKIQRMSKSCNWCRVKHVGCQAGHVNPGPDFVKGVTKGPTWRAGCGPAACKERGHKHGDDSVEQDQLTPSAEDPQATASDAHASRSPSPAQELEAEKGEQHHEPEAEEENDRAQLLSKQVYDEKANALGTQKTATPAEEAQ